jgi:transcriptional regulator with GAF, ATPase, and Fis domain
VPRLRMSTALRATECVRKARTHEGGVDMEDSLISSPTDSKSWIAERREANRSRQQTLPQDGESHASTENSSTTECLEMARIAKEVEAVGPLRSTVLITGETGTGKGVIASRIHECSNREDRPFVHVDCAALAANLIESELFGHERGAFTGAVDRRIGRFESAENGTIFLDEIGELPLGLQSKLLHVLQERRFERIGGNRSFRMSARVIAATNRNLESEVQRGRFRQDLLYRVDVFRIELPPLRERVEDIPGLVESGLEKIATELGVSRPSLPDPVLQRLRRHTWPGNVRELMNVLERLVIRHGAGLLDELSIDQLFRRHPQGVDRISSPHHGRLPAAGSDAEREILEHELAESGGNVARVARRIGIARSTLRYRIARHDLKHLVPTD